MHLIGVCAQAGSDCAITEFWLQIKQSSGFVDEHFKTSHIFVLQIEGFKSCNTLASIHGLPLFSVLATTEAESKHRVRIMVFHGWNRLTYESVSVTLIVLVLVPVYICVCYCRQRKNNCKVCEYSLWLIFFLDKLRIFTFKMFLLAKE